MKAAYIENGIVINVGLFADGAELPAGWVPLTGDAAIGWNYDGAVFTAPVIAPSDHAAARIAALVADCRAHIVGGVVSDALGADHTYPTEQTDARPDQHNLNGLVSMSMVMAQKGILDWTCKFWCADSQGVWDRRSHTIDQIQAVGLVVGQHVIDAQDQITALKAQIIAIRDGAGTDEEKRAAMDLVVWPA